MDYRAKFGPEDAELAANLLGQHVGNIEGAIFALDRFQRLKNLNHLPFMLWVHVLHMCLGWLVLTVTKTQEIWQIYGFFAEKEAREAMPAALAEGERLGIPDLRDKTIAHVIHRDTGKPMTPEKLEEVFGKVFEENPERFLHWIRHPTDPKAATFCRAHRLFRNDLLVKFPAMRITMPVSIYATPQGNVEF
jgi:hypothetical protein